MSLFRAQQKVSKKTYNLEKTLIERQKMSFLTYKKQGFLLKTILKHFTQILGDNYFLEYSCVLLKAHFYIILSIN